MANLGKAGNTCSSLIVNWNESDVEAGCVFSQGQVDVGQSAFVRAIPYHGATVKRPCCAILAAGFLTNAGACEGVRIGVVSDD